MLNKVSIIGAGNFLGSNTGFKVINKNIYLANFVAFLITVIGTLCLISIEKTFQVNEVIPYEYVDISYNEVSKTKIRDHAIKIGKGKFLLAVNNPVDLNLALEFGSKHQISYTIKPLYPDWICKSGWNHAVLSLSSERYERNSKLIYGQEQRVEAKVLAGEQFKVNFVNVKQSDCGRAEVAFERQSKQDLFVWIFASVWFLVLAAIICLRIPIFIGGLGVVLNLIAIFGNATLSHLALDLSLNALVLSLAAVAVLVAVYQFNMHRLVRGGLSLVFFIIILASPLFYVGHYILFDQPVINDTVHALWQSDSLEVLEFMESNVNFWVFIGGVLLLIGSFYIFCLKHSALKPILGSFFGLILLVPTIVVLTNQSVLNPMFRMFQNGTTEYFQELEGFKEWRKQRSDLNPLPTATISNESRTTILVLGESANKNHMSLYGYPRDTTPNAEELLSDGQLIRFSRAYSSHTHTGRTVSHALTQADQYTDLSWKTAPSIIEVAKSVGIETIWITNQQTFGAWDNQVSVLAREADIVASKNKRIGIAKDAYKFDEALIPALEKALKGGSQQKLIVLHLQGSHASYCRRFPEQHSPFAGVQLERDYFGVASLRPDTGLINCYDNSIYYTDQIIKNIIDLLDQRRESASLLYVADHSEDIFGGRAHNSAVFTYNMTEIPLFFWANSHWKDSYSENWKNLSSNNDKVFTNDHTFETILGLFGVKSEQVSSANDLSSADFMSVEEPLTLLGNKKLDAAENWRFWQDENSLNIQSDGKCSKVLPHRTNTIGKIKAALNLGLCGVEIDVLPTKEEGGKFVFSIGHDAKTLTGLSLDKLLQLIPNQRVSKIWLDVKNVNRNNIQDTLSRLNELDNLYDLKSRAIIETSYHGIQSRMLSEAGYELSYYLPTGAVLEVLAMDEKEIGARKELASELVKRINTMQPKAISFDLKLYRFVKDYLENQISEDLSYHTWFPGDLTLYTPNLLNELKKKNFYNDVRVETILAHYHSPFHL